MYQTDQYEGMIAETVTITGANGDEIYAYLARPLGPGPFPGMVLAHHMPGWDEWYREATRKFAHHGYATISPDLYHRVGHGTPEDVAAKARSLGGVPDDQAVGDLAGAMHFLRGQPYSSGKKKKASSAPAPADATPIWPRAGRRASTPSSICGAAAW
ncbi:MAG: dienelactone hydrolase family protein [Caldilineaceae bacterium]|nr:dienelactone hydrolase family protein [Caldilineaceae bacterium]